MDGNEPDETRPGHPVAQAELDRLMTAASEHHQAGRLDQARPLYERVLAAMPYHADALHLHGVLHLQADDPSTAVPLLAGAVQAAPQEAPYHYNLGEALRALGDFEAAAASYRRVLAIDPGVADAHYNLGNCLYEIGDLYGALECYRHAVELAPADAEAYNNLGNAYAELDRIEDAATAYRRATQIDPRFAMAHNNYGNMQAKLGRADDALASYRRALELRPKFARVHLNLGLTLMKRGDVAAATDAFRAAVAARADFAEGHVNLANALLAGGDKAGALDVLDRYLETDGANTRVLAARTVVLTELDRRDEARHLLGYGRLLRKQMIAPPADYAGIAAFNNALMAHVLGHPTLIEAPASHATQFGRHTGNLIVGDMGPVADLAAAISAAVEDYRRALPPDPTHPFLADRPSKVKLSLWAVVMQAQGHQIPHIHPAAWLSGVYYAKVPAAVAESKAGWIEFGRPGDNYCCKAEPETHLVRPEEGLLILFPSYIYHRTIPFETSETRISLAFDLIPEA